MPAGTPALHDGKPRLLQGETIGIDEAANLLLNARRNEISSTDEFGIQREALAQSEAAHFGLAAQLADLGPCSFRVDEVSGDRRNAAPIVDASLQQAGEIRVA